MTVGQALIHLLEAHGVDTVFGIPGVHTAELYRGLAGSNIRHVTPRDEQDAGFMADGYARVSGKPGVCLLITGPGLTNAITPMAQARADSIPMLVISGVNARHTHGHYRGYLHELPDQSATMRTIALSSERLENPDDIAELIERAFARMQSGRPGPVHIEILTDLMEASVSGLVGNASQEDTASGSNIEKINEAATLCAAASRPLILAGGGANRACEAVLALAEALDAPVVTTTNARGLLGRHPLMVPASPSLPPIRQLIAEADLVIAIGTQFGPTDYDMYVDGGFKPPARMIRIDIDPDAAATSYPATLAITGDAARIMEELVAALHHLPQARRDAGKDRASVAMDAAYRSLSPKMQSLIEVLGTVRDAIPGGIIVGDSTQLAYAGNLFFETDFARSWFNAATGYGALGFGPPAAIGASLAQTGAPVICLVGDGGFQFCLGTLGTAVDEKVPVIFLVWNNHGYQEIEDYMLSRDITPIGVRPSAPDFVKLAEAYGMSAEQICLTNGDSQDALRPGALDLARLSEALSRARQSGRPALIEITTP
ncbi:acetolactate synthase-1/2/3 large subunit [Ochrobactrum daejeonense]|uniref:Acetolactate synthase-1/2/3 large subunit n=1 Tax=Brucella daejeonensis TaxID=659015 RepID=A0A7W9AV48_9HYPH|nr:5-guanidino-2-oxopentanoate decarboxylase [Brucella daejeonensis]MBB5701169.1 acetolactate synthase-1/2/3 large subunit [Brucella daejeonensis]